MKLIEELCNELEVSNLSQLHSMFYKYFYKKITEVNELKVIIDAPDKEIDLMLNKLYDLTFDEVLYRKGEVNWLLTI